MLTTTTFNQHLFSHKEALIPHTLDDKFPEKSTNQQTTPPPISRVLDPTDPVGRPLFNVLAMAAEFEADLIRARTREGMAVA